MVFDLAKEANWRAKEAEVKTPAVKEKATLVVSCAIENFKGLGDFKNELGEALYDAYLKGFAECKAKSLKPSPISTYGALRSRLDRRKNRKVR